MASSLVTCAAFARSGESATPSITASYAHRTAPSDRGGGPGRRDPSTVGIRSGAAASSSSAAVKRPWPISPPGRSERPRTGNIGEFTIRRQAVKAAGAGRVSLRSARVRCATAEVGPLPQPISVKRRNADAFAPRNVLLPRRFQFTLDPAVWPVGSAGRPRSPRPGRPQLRRERQTRIAKYGDFCRRLTRDPAPAKAPWGPDWRVRFRHTRRSGRTGSELVGADHHHSGSTAPGRRQ